MEFVQKNFIPVAVKAGTMGDPPPGVEGDLYRELRRTRPAGQGMCVMNSSGNVLSWALAFEDNASVIGFLSYALERYRESPDASSKPIVERFRRFPQHKQPDLPGGKGITAVPIPHAAGERCPGELPKGDGSLIARMVGRVFDSDGNPLPAETRSQDNYVEDRVEISRASQIAFQEALASVPTGEDFRVPHEFARALVSDAYLGMLDVSPLGGKAVGGKVTREDLHLWARKSRKNDDKHSVIEIWGTSIAAGEAADLGRQTDGRDWEHRVELTWKGAIGLESGEIATIAMLADGRERLRWNNRLGEIGRDSDGKYNDVAHLLSGRPIDFEGPVRYGLSVP